MRIRIDVSPGELIDKLSILDIKMSKLEDGEKLHNVTTERDAIAPSAEGLFRQEPEIRRLFEALTGINEELWEIEDRIRHCEARGDFGPTFVELARSVYFTNDRRAAVKREINEILGSALKEEKQYVDYASNNR